MRQKLFLSFTVIVLISVLLVAVIARRGAVNEVTTFMFRGGMFGLSDLVTSLERYYQRNGSWANVQALIDVSPKGMGAMMGQRLLVLDRLGRVVADSQNTRLGETLDPALLSSFIPLTVNGKTVGYFGSAGGMVFNIANEQLVLRRLNRGVIYAGLLAGALGLILATALSYTLLRPVRELTLAAQGLARGDLTRRVTVHGDDELATLGLAFNHMADSLQQVEESRRAMTADIAHELRTPLAVQRANLEALQDGIYPLTAENLAPVIDQNHLLTRLVEDLRTLALTDAGQIELECSPINLPALVARVIERFQPQATSQQVSLILSPTDPSIPPILVDPTRFEQMLTNLLSNALRYTPPGGRIEVALAALQGVIRLSVHDSGPGIPAESLPYIFERFYRGDKSRTRSEGGSGLGLAIARNLARAHGGDLIAANHASGGALFTLTLPMDGKKNNPG